MVTLQRDTTTEEKEQSAFMSTISVPKNRYGVLDNQIAIGDTESYSTPYVQQTEEQEDSSYEVEKEYKINGIQEDRNIIPTFMPTIQPKEVYKEEAYIDYDYKIKLNSRGKIIVSVVGIISALLMVLCIYNAVMIGKLSSTLAAKETSYTQMQKEVSLLEAGYNTMPTSTEIQAETGFSKPSDLQTVDVGVRPELDSVPESTNWFNNLCETIAGLFN